jgi:hypothetical protein
MRIGAVLMVLAVLGLAACADGDQLGPDGRPRAAGADQVRRAANAYATSAPVRRAGDYATAVAQGLVSDPLLAGAQRNQLAVDASRRGMNPSRPLSDDERCVGSSIVRVTHESGVQTYTQVLQGGRPIFCRGGY